MFCLCTSAESGLFIPPLTLTCCPVTTAPAPANKAHVRDPPLRLCTPPAPLFLPPSLHLHVLLPGVWGGCLISMGAKSGEVFWTLDRMLVIYISNRFWHV